MRAVAEPPHDPQQFAGDPSARIGRLCLVIQIVRAWCIGEQRHSEAVTRNVRAWIDGGLRGPLPWPDDPAFDAWAVKQGLLNNQGHVGFRRSARPMTDTLH